MRAPTYHLQHDNKTVRRLERHRKRLGIGQVEFGRRLGLGTRVYESWIGGSRDPENGTGRWTELVAKAKKLKKGAA